jgi:hypothetical protein
VNPVNRFDQTLREVEARQADAGRNGPPAPPAAPTAAEVIRAYFREVYRPAFRSGNCVVSRGGETVDRAAACSTPTSRLIDRLAGAADAPAYKGGGVNRNALPGFFRKWAPVAWGDLLAELPDEETAELGADAQPAEEFRRLVREALLSEITLGDVIGRQGVVQTERRSLIGWCMKFARSGPWRSIRSKLCWCRLLLLEGGELRLQVAIRHELFSQVAADPRLRKMGANRFTRLAQKYGVGACDRRNRPHGRSVVVLADDLIADLTAGMPDDGDATLEAGGRRAVTGGGPPGDGPPPARLPPAGGSSGHR